MELVHGTVLVGSDIQAALAHAEAVGQVVQRQVEGGGVRVTEVDAGGASADLPVVAAGGIGNAGSRINETRVVHACLIAGVGGAEGDIGRTVIAAFDRGVGYHRRLANHIGSSAAIMVTPRDAVGVFVIRRRIAYAIVIYKIAVDKFGLTARLY